MTEGIHAQPQASLAADRDWFRSTYESHAGLVFYVASQSPLSNQDQEEVVQETFLKLYQNADKISRESLKRWLVVTARHLVIDRLRKLKRMNLTAEPEGLESQADNTASLHHELELSYLRDLITEVSQGPGGESFRLFYLDGWSAAEIASKQGEAISTVTTRLSRQRRKLRGLFKSKLEAFRDELHRKGGQ